MCEVCRGFGCPTCEVVPQQYCAENPVEWCTHWDARACDGVPRADGTCPYTDAAAEAAGQDAWDARQADAEAALREGA